MMSTLLPNSPPPRYPPLHTTTSLIRLHPNEANVTNPMGLAPAPRSVPVKRKARLGHKNRNQGKHQRNHILPLLRNPMLDIQTPAYPQQPHHTTRRSPIILRITHRFILPRRTRAVSRQLLQALRLLNKHHLLQSNHKVRPHKPSHQLHILGTHLNRLCTRTTQHRLMPMLHTQLCGHSTVGILLLLRTPILARVLALMVFQA